MRSLPLSRFAALAGIPGVRLISLQKGFGLEQLTGAVQIPLPDFDEGPDAFHDTAAIIAASSKVDMHFVMTMQMVRLVAVLVITPPLTKLIASRSQT